MAVKKAVFLDIPEDDREKCEQIYKKYFDYLKEYFRKHIEDYSRADDFIHETLLRVFRHINEIMDKTETEQKKLITVYARNVILNEFTYDKRHGYTVFSELDTENEKGEITDFEDNYVSDIDTQDAVIDEELKNALKTEISRLDPTKRQALTMMYYEGMKTDEIARELKMNSSTLRSMLSNTYKYLRNKLMEYL